MLGLIYIFFFFVPLLNRWDVHIMMLITMNFISYSVSLHTSGLTRTERTRTLIQSFPHSHIHSFAHTHIHSFADTHIHSFIRTFTHSFIRNRISFTIYNTDVIKTKERNLMQCKSTYTMHRIMKT